MSKISDLLELATPEERERLRAARLDFVQREMSLFKTGRMYLGHPNPNKVAKSRARNRVARQSRRINQAVRKGHR